MEGEKFLGEPSNCSSNNTNSNNSSTTNNSNNNSATINNAELSSNKIEHRPSSSSSSHRQPSAAVDDEGEGLGDDGVGWYCSLCTFKNSIDKFKCEVCDLRRPSTSTSTRKPRCNADTIVAQVVKQQEQIRQQTRAKPTKIRSSAGLNATSSNESSSNSKNRHRSLDSKNRKTTEMIGELTEDELYLNSDSDSDSESASSPHLKRKRSQQAKTSTKSEHRTNKSYDKNNDLTDDSTSSELARMPHVQRRKKRRSLKAKASKKNDHKISKNADNDNDDDGSSKESSCTDISSYLSQLSSSRVRRTPSESSLSTSHYSSSSSAISPEPTTSSPLPPSSQVSDNPFKITSLEVNGNLIKYSPPTSSGRTGLIIDKKRFTQHSVTVNDVTITFTEFATRQNKYVRKKKKRREFSRPKSNHGNGKSRPQNKNDSKSNPNNASSAAQGDT